MEYHENKEELCKALDFSIALFGELYQESKQAPYITMMGLFATMVEQCQALSTLIENNQFSATQSITRNILEIYVDIKNIENDLGYIDYLWAECHDREKGFAKTRPQKALARKLRDEKYSLYRLNEGYKKLEIAQKFNQAGLKKHYSSVYCMLSAHTHSGVFLLLNRIAEGSESNDLSSQGLFKQFPSEVELLSLPLITNYLLDACDVVASGHDEESYSAALEMISNLSVRY